MQAKGSREQAESPNTNVTRMENNYSQEQSQKKKYTTAIRKHVRRRMTVILTAGAVVIVPLFGNLLGNISEIGNLDGKIAEAKNEQKLVEEKNKDLKVEIGLLQDDEYLAKLARSRYYLSKDKEIIFSLPEDNHSKAAEQKVSEGSSR